MFKSDPVRAAAPLPRTRLAQRWRLHQGLSERVGPGPGADLDLGAGGIAPPEEVPGHEETVLRGQVEKNIYLL